MADPSSSPDLAAFLRRHGGRGILRLITCGSVDDGKSTLIGRLLYDSHAVFEDQLSSLADASARWGTTGEAPDLALLLDGLQAEREQGITIDVAYKYFDTGRRKLIIADTPGHEQYTRNMATAASTADLAVLIVDATKGASAQTRRHTAIAQLMGIRHLVITVNKMDLVGFDRDRFERVRDGYLASLGGLADRLSIVFVPVSALHGDNVVRRSDNTPWYEGPSLLEHLETVDARPPRAPGRLRFPVQYVIRPDSTFRGYAGTVVAGEVRVGDAVLALPSRQRTRVKGIVTFDGEAGGHPVEAVEDDAVTLVLEDDLDVTRGDVLAHPNDAPSVTDAVEANLIWLDEQPLVAGKAYGAKVGTRLTQGTVRAPLHRVDIDTFAEVEDSALRLNEIGRAQVSFSTPVVVDPYTSSPRTGSFVLIDPITHATAAAGMVLRSARESRRAKATNVTWHESRVTKAVRARLKEQTPCCLWFTGLSGAGKSTIANALEHRLAAMGFHTYLLDGDNLRHGLNKDLGFSDEDRIENIRRVGEVARLFVDAGLIVITAFISPFRSDRQMARDLFEAGEFLEVFVDTPLEVAERRDPKGLYAKARAGLLSNFTGIDSPYERPEEPEIVLHAGEHGVERCVEDVVRSLVSRGLIGQAHAGEP